MREGTSRAGRPRRDDRSEEAKAYRRLYRTAAWKRMRAAQLARQPLCERCVKAGRVTAATVVNHRDPHKGDMARFSDRANLESACAPCHDGAIQSEERRGYSTEIGADGWPTCERHPMNAKPDSVRGSA